MSASSPMLLCRGGDLLGPGYGCAVPGLQVASDALASEEPLQLRHDSSDYWDSQGWLPGPAFAGAADPWARFADSPAADAAGGLLAAPASRPLEGPGSDAYWAAGPWGGGGGPAAAAAPCEGKHPTPADAGSPDGADAGLPLLRCWPGGLASLDLGLGAEPGPPAVLGAAAAGGGPAPSLRELYELRPGAIGAGAFGVVRRGRHRATGRDCVVKAVRAGERYRRALADGGLLAGALRMSRETPHPNITLFLDVLAGPEYYYVVMEVLAALAHLHDTVGIFHRDVKLGNFRFRADPADSALVLLDFGFSGFINQPWDGVVCGTMEFMAPEVAGKRARMPHLAAVDLWSAGVILYVLLTGEQPFQEQEVRLLGDVGPRAAEAARLLQRALGAPALARASRDARELLGRLLALEPGERLTAARALQQPWFGGPGLAS